MLRAIDFKTFQKEVTKDDRVLVSYTGGIDSVTALYRILAETECRVIVHHAHLKNREGRWRAEARAVKNTLKYFEDHVRKPEKFIETDINFGPGNYYGLDIVVSGFLAGHIIFGESREGDPVKYIANGLNADDARSNNLDYLGGFPSARGYRIIDAYNDDNKPTIVNPICDFKKVDVVNFLPTALTQLTWSCRTPKKSGRDFKRCGKCKTCKEFKSKGLWDLTPNDMTLPKG